MNRATFVIRDSVPGLVLFLLVCLAIMTGVLMVLDTRLIALIVVLFLAVILAWRGPGVVIALYIFVCADIFAQETLPVLSLGTGSLTPADLLLMVLAFSLLLHLDEARAVWRRLPFVIRAGYLIWLLVLTCRVGLSLIANELVANQVIREARVFLPYMMFVPLLMRMRSQRHVLTIMLFYLAVGVSTSVVTLLTQLGVVVPHSIGLQLSIGTMYGVSRVVSAGELFQLSAFILGFSLVLLFNMPRRRKVLITFAAIICLVAVTIGFRRTYVIVTLLFFCAFYGVQLVRSGLRLERVWVGVVLVACAFVFLSMLVDLSSVYLRLQSIVPAVLEQNDTVGDRIAEWNLAWNSFVKAPFFGIGIGAYYGKFTGNDWMGYVSQSYIHNMYLWLMTKTGIVGLLGFLAWVTAALRSSIQALGARDAFRSNVATVSLLLWLSLLTIGFWEAGFSSLTWSTNFVLAFAFSAYSARNEMGSVDLGTCSVRSDPITVPQSECLSSKRHAGNGLSCGK